MCFPPRFVVGSNRVIFMLRDGGYAWEVKDFLVAQDRCADVTVEGQVYPGKAAKKEDKAKASNDIKPKSKSKNKEKMGTKESNKANKQREEL